MRGTQQQVSLSKQVTRFGLTYSHQPDMIYHSWPFQNTLIIGGADVTNRAKVSRNVCHPHGFGTISALVAVAALLGNA